MALPSGTQLGPYEIISLVGAGGMGEVYRAKDTRLERIVAIKVLPAHLSDNPDLKQRFEREARTISSLSHPNICALHDVGHHNGINFLVMEFLEGESLADRLHKGPLTTELVLRHGIQIADALDKAHKQGIIHRDLKPGNIMLTKSGAKLLDFGLAKYQQTESSGASQSELETRDKPLTEKGVVMGTVQYMAPEQLEGKESDARTDIFALGEVVYEMATGRRAFKGNSKAQLIAAILSTEPEPISIVQPLAPPALDHVVKKCLAKDPEDRWQSAHDVAAELKWIGEAPTTSSIAAIPRSKNREHFWMLCSAILLLVALGLAFLHWKKAPAVASILSMPVPGNTPPFAHAISPDGHFVGFISPSASGQISIWVRSFDSFTARELPDTEGASFLFWSPDSRYIGFFAQSKLKKIAVDGGAAQTICDAPGGRGGSWSKNGVILFTPAYKGGIYRVSDSGGVSKLEAGSDPSQAQDSWRWPYFLPDARHYLFLIRSVKEDENGIYLGTLDSHEKKKLLSDVSTAAFANSGHILFVRDEKNLMAQPFDAKSLQLRGEAVTVAANASYAQNTVATYADFSVSETGVLTYSPAAGLKSQLTWFDRTGKQIGVLGEPGLYIGYSLSPDEKQLAVARQDSSTATARLWIVELSSGSFTRFSFESGNFESPIWSPDGKQIVFDVTRGGTQDLYQKTSSGAGKEEILLRSKDWKAMYDWSSDGRYILYGAADSMSKWNLWILPVFGDKKPSLFLKTKFNELAATFSPDGKWVSYTSDETGKTEIYVSPFPDSNGGRWQVSNNGGIASFWRHDAKEMFYVTNDSKKIMSVTVKSDLAFQSGVPTTLFQTNAPITYAIPTRDGQRFLLAITSTEGSSTPITVIQNWTSLLNSVH